MILGVLFHLYASPCVQAQRFGRIEGTDTNLATYYYFVQPGMATVRIHVLGTVRSPGVYELNKGTDLGEALAFSGGPTLAVRPRANQREVMVRLFRPQMDNPLPLYEAEFNNAIGSPSTYPVLEDGDVLTVEIIERQGFSWRDGLTIVSGLSAIASVVIILAQNSR